MKKVIINRKMWLRGDRSNSYLLRHDNKMCCLGFACKQLMLAERKEILDKRGLSITAEEFLNPKINAAYWLNDTPTLDDATRETRLIKLFNEVGIELSFIG